MTDFVYSLLIERMRTKTIRTASTHQRQFLTQAVRKLEYRRNLDRAKNESRAGAGATRVSRARFARPSC